MLPVCRRRNGRKNDKGGAVMHRITYRFSRAHAVLCLIVLVYTVLSFWNLGDALAPVTQPDLGEGEGRGCLSYAAFPEPTALDSLILYKGLGTCGVTVYIPDESGDNWVEVSRQVCDAIYAWEEIPLSCTTNLICVSIGGDAQAEVYEAGFLSEERTVVPVLSEGDALFDEQELVPTMATHRNGTYFDEVYHVRTAYEHLQGISPYEISHPPLGKLLIALGIAVCGMHPLGWRIVGCLCGIAMIPVLYLLAKRLFGREDLSLAAAALLSLDFMHFTQTRIALIDAPAVLLILLMYLLMYRYYHSTPEELPYRQALVRLVLCGAVMGFGISVKWTVVYAALGLAVLFAIGAVRRHRLGESAFRTCLWCVLFFGVVPLVIYFLSYLPYYMADPATPAWNIFWDNQVYMLTYHGGLDAAHAFSSPWYTWPLMLRPIWYYGAKALAAEGLCSSITAFGNPAVWWCGILCMLLLLLKRRKTRADVFILIGFAAQYLTWAFITRPTFIYHFFASVPFLILAAVSVIGDLSTRYQRCRFLLPGLLTCAAVLFVMFYPVFSGMVVDRGYVMQVLSWLPGWVLGY